MQFLSYVCVWNVFTDVYIQDFVDQFLLFKTNKIFKVVQDFFYSRFMAFKNSIVQGLCYSRLSYPRVLLVK